MTFVSTLLSFGGCAPHTGGLPPTAPESGHLALARREILEFEGAGRAELATELFAPDYALHFPGFPPLDARGHAQVMEMFRAAFPDLSIDVVEQVTEGDLVANHIVMRGTQKGAFQGIAATGRAVEVSGTNLMRFNGDQIAEAWGFLDNVSLLEQLGAMPAGPPRDVPPAPTGAIGTPSEAKASVQRFVAAFNAKEVDALMGEFGDVYVLDFPGGPRGKGPEGIRDAARAFITAFPDLHFATDAMISDGQGVAWRWTMTGTQRGPLGPFGASGNPVTLTGLSLLHVRDGKIVDDRVRADMVGLLGQIGALPPHP